MKRHLHVSLSYMREGMHTEQHGSFIFIISERYRYGCWPDLEDEEEERNWSTLSAAGTATLASGNPKLEGGIR